MFILLLKAYNKSNLSQEIQKLLAKPLPVKSSLSSFNLEKPENIDHDLHLRNIEGFLAGTGTFNNLEKPQKDALVSFLYLFVAMFGSLQLSVCPFHYCLSSQLAVRAGTGSSASFTVCIVASFLHYIKLIAWWNGARRNLSKPGYEKCSLTYKSNRKFFKDEELKAISDWSFLGEKIHHGNPSGNFVFL